MRGTESILAETSAVRLTPGHGICCLEGALDTPPTYMLKLSFFLKRSAAPAVSLELADLRVTGGTLWNPMNRELIAICTDGSWKRCGTQYATLTVTGGGCLLFGITRDPTIVSDPIDHFYFIGPALSANGVAIARYVAQQDMWQGLVRPMWWNAMRILGVEAVSTAVSESQAVLLNPWEPQPMQSPIYLDPERPRSSRSRVARTYLQVVFDKRGEL